jgi:oxygen-independent coproporphyrinogen-3 oxidase
LIAGGTRYHAHFVPDDDLTADLYERAVERLNQSGVQQYEISNFARAGWESRHNLKYWTRQPYLGFGVDAHSMLRVPNREAAGCETPLVNAVRFATTDNLERYVSGAELHLTPVSQEQALEEAYFLGLRLVGGIDLSELAEQFGPSATIAFRQELAEMAQSGLVELNQGHIRLTPRGRLISNEVFARLISHTESSFQ